MLKEEGLASQLIALDVNPLAIDATLKTARENEVRRRGALVAAVVIVVADAPWQIDTLEAIRSDLLTALLPRLEGKLDIIIFNPPYVPTEDDEVAMDGIEASYAGGERGRRVIDRFMPMMHVRPQDRLRKRRWRLF